MRRAPITFCLAAFALGASACGGSDELNAKGSPSARRAIVGTYSCKHPGDTEPTVYEFEEDGAATIKTPGFTDRGTWSGEGTEGVMTVEGNDTRFTIEGDRLVFPGDRSHDCSTGS